MNILFVCTGNTCRSPMAEGLFKEMLNKNKIKHINVSSAGISAFPEEYANEKAIAALKDKGIDIIEHKAKQLVDEINNADLILTMTDSHKKVIVDYYNKKTNKKPPCPEKTNDTSPCLRVFTLKEFAAKISGEKLTDSDILDPYGMSYNTYEKVRDEIEKQLIKIFNNMDKLEDI